MKSEWDDSEFLTWSEEARYRFQERLGMSCGDAPFDGCDPEAIEEAREQARLFELRMKKAKQ